MENPRTWGPVEKTIHEAFKKWEQGTEQMLCGLSLEMTIANALREAGLVREDNGDIPQD